MVLTSDKPKLTDIEADKVSDTEAIPALVGAVRAVLAVHRPKHYGRLVLCARDENVYPCSTVEAIDAHVGLA
jgi:hypothetical protein